MDVLESALYWAQRGIPVFPCGTDKRPLTSNGFYDATTDERKIRALFEFNGDCFVGGRMGSASGLFAMDFDLYKEQEARSYMEYLQANGALPDSQVHLTKSGGVHVIYYSDSEWPNTKPVPGVEVKGEGGYIILPDSPGYKVEREGIERAPDALLRILHDAKRASKETDTSAHEASILSGESFHEPLTVLAARWSSRGMSAAAVFGKLFELLENSMARRPLHARHNRWQNLINNADNELMRIASSGDAKFNPDTKDEFVREQTANAEQFAATADKFFDRTSGGKDAPKPDEAALVDDAWAFEGEGFSMLDNFMLHEQKFILAPMLVEGETMLIGGHPKAGKSAIALDMAIHIACGVDISAEQKVPEARPVLYFALEGVRAVKLRIQAKLKFWREQGVEPTAPQLFVIEKSKDFFTPEHQAAVVKQIAAADRQAHKKWGNPLGAVFIDTLTRAMPGGNQNDASETGQFFNTVPLLRDLGLSAAYVVIHHLRKDGETRGSTNIEAEVDVIAKVTRDVKTDNVSLYIDNARSIEAGDAFYYKFDNVSLGKTSQGYPLSAPVVRPLTPEETADAADSAVKSAASNGKVLDILSDMAKGRHPLDAVMVTLSRGGALKSSLQQEAHALAEVRMLLATVVERDSVTYKGKLIKLSRDGTGSITAVVVLTA